MPTLEEVIKNKLEIYEALTRKINMLEDKNFVYPVALNKGEQLQYARVGLFYIGLDLKEYEDKYAENDKDAEGFEI